VTKTTVHIAAFLSMLFWGISYVWSKIVFEYYTPLTTIFIRLLISFILLLLFMKMSGRFQVMKRKDIWIFAMGALFNPFLYFIGESYGLKIVSASVSAFIIATIPVFTPIVAYLFLREKLNKQNLIGLLVSFAGVLFIIVRLDLSLTVSPMGIGLLFMAVLSAIIYAVILKKLSAKYRPVTIVAWQELIGSLYFLPFFLYFDFDSVLAITPSAKALLSLLMLGIFASAISYVLYTFVIQNMKLSKANIYVNLIPVFAVITAYFILDEIFTPMKIVGMILVIFGVVLSQMNEQKKKV
jgi:drug/metabolite transporter (DMT)-like permease